MASVMTFHLIFVYSFNSKMFPEFGLFLDDVAGKLRMMHAVIVCIHATFMFFSEKLRPARSIGVVLTASISATGKIDFTATLAVYSFEFE